MSGSNGRTRKAVIPEVPEFTGSNIFVEDPDDAAALRAEVARLEDMGEEELLRQARKASFKLLLAKLNLGIITAPEQSVLRALLRDNGMVLDFGDEKPKGDQATGFHLPDLNARDDDDDN